MTHLAYETHGSKDKPALMLLHGFMSSNAQWMANISELAAHHYLILVELWGHGLSPQPATIRDYSVARYLEEFEFIREQQALRCWSVIGQSYGAGLVCHYALTHPDKVTKVVVTNSRSAFGAITGARTDNRERQQKVPTDLRKLPYHPINARRFPESIKAALVSSADQMQPTTIRDSSNLAAELNFIQHMAALPQPVLLTNGIYEQSFQPEVRQLKALCPQLQVADLQGGHSINIEDAEGFNRVVLEFLA